MDSNGKIVLNGDAWLLYFCAFFSMENLKFERKNFAIFLIENPGEFDKKDDPIM
jgi:hypothetical protein